MPTTTGYQPPRPRTPPPEPPPEPPPTGPIYVPPRREGESYWDDYARWLIDQGLPPPPEDDFSALLGPEFDEPVSYDDWLATGTSPVDASPPAPRRTVAAWSPPPATAKEPPKPPGPVRKKKRAKVGGKPKWMEWAELLANGINPVTGQPFGFDVNRGADGRRYSFGGPPASGDADRDTVEKLDSLRVYATGEGPKSVETEPTPVARRPRRRRVGLSRRPDLDLGSLLQECPVPSVAELRDRGLGGLANVAPTAEDVARLQGALRHGLDFVQGSIREIAERILEPVRAREAFSTALEEREASKGRLIREARRQYELEGGRNWSTERWLGLASRIRREHYVTGTTPRLNSRAGDRAWYESAWDYKRETARIEALERTVAALEYTRFGDRSRIVERLADELVTLEALEPELARLGIGAPGASDGRASALDLWRRYCRLNLFVRNAHVLLMETEAAEGAILGYENFLAEKDGNSFFGTGWNLGLYSTQDAPERMARAMTDRVVSLRANEILERADTDEYVRALYRSMHDNHSAVVQAVRDNAAVQHAMGKVHAWADWITGVAEDSLIDVATLGAFKAVASARKLLKAADAAGDLGRAAKRGKRAIRIDPSRVRSSQSTARYERVYDKYGKLARGEAVEPIDVVRMPDGTLTSLDETRRYAADLLDQPIRAYVRKASDLMPLARARQVSKGGRLRTPRTWGEAIETRVADQRAAFRAQGPFGSLTRPDITGPPPDLYELRSVPFR